MNEDYILKKTVDWSLLNRGFAIPVEMQAVFSLHLSGGTLKHGEKRTIKIIFNNEHHEATLTSVNFNRQKYPDHKDMWQVVYSQNGTFATNIRNLFSSSLKLFSELRKQKQEQRILNLPENNTKH